MAAWPVFGVFALAFASEDAAVISGAVLAASGTVSSPAVFGACFLGIWLGDLGLFLLARRFGRPLVERLWGARRGFAEKMHRSEEWFRRRGLAAIVLCRLVPGTRLPTFLAAGLLRMPVASFSVLTALLALAWVGLVFGLFSLLGKVSPETLDLLRRHALAIAAGVGALWLVSRGWRGLRGSVWLRRWRQWEFWPSWVFYLPIGLKVLQLAVRHGSLNLPASANPGMATGGIIGESKFATLDDLQRAAPNEVARSFLLDPACDRMAVLDRLEKSGRVTFPFVLKPDVGQRGSGFRVVRNREAAAAYLAAVDGAVVAQEYVPGPQEVGIFYYRFPGETKGRIFAMTEKIFPVLRGDGLRTVEELIRADGRAVLLANTYLRRFHDRRAEVLAVGESLRLVEAGNHAQGCIFRDGAALWSEALETRIDAISRAIPGFYIGRYDLRFADAEALRQGSGFRILELNGAASEATSAYDASHSLVDAYRILFRQWELVFAIGAANRARGHRAESVSHLLAEWKRYRAQAQGHPAAD